MESYKSEIVSHVASSLSLSFKACDLSAISDEPLLVLAMCAVNVAPFRFLVHGQDDFDILREVEVRFRQIILHLDFLPQRWPVCGVGLYGCVDRCLLCLEIGDFCVQP